MKTHALKLGAASLLVGSMFLFQNPMSILAAPDETETAQPSGSYSISLEKAVPAGSYSLYQLATGSYAVPGSTQMGDVIINPELKQVIEKTIQSFTPDFKASGSTETQANQIAGAISSIASSASGDVSIQNFANQLASAISGMETAPSVLQTLKADENGTLSFDNLPSGYYLLVSNDDPAYEKDNGAFTRAILVPLSEDTRIESKNTGLSDFKKQALVNDQPVSVADLSLVSGKAEVPEYQISADVSGLYQYDVYPIVFTDDLPAGLTTDTAELDSSWNVEINATDGKETKSLTSAFENSASAADDSSQLKFVCKDLKTSLETAGFTEDEINAFNAEFTITLSYTPVLDETDINNMFSSPSSLSTPFINSAMVAFPKDPYTKGEGMMNPDGSLNPEETSSTPSSQVNTYSFNLQVNKIGPDKKPLKGAGFTLSSESEPAGKEITADDNGTFTFTGLASGKKYVLTETAVPAGMQQIDPIEFTISETLDETGTAVASISGDISSDPDSAAALSVNDGSIVLTVTNLAGHALPSTGMSGMSWMALCIAAASGGLIYLMASKRKERD